MLASTVSSDSDLINGFNKALATPRRVYSGSTNNTGMKRNTKYGIKVIANKKVKNKVWHSDSKAYNMSLV